ncbi:MAG: hypothetical protein F6K10_26610 [Moorea sp. SIO2B7]|nr:hypothetical protein [Moorena sp. SIO2B7]
MQHLTSQKQSEMISQSPPFVLDSFIQITTENITPQRDIFHGVCFHLNQESLSEIQQAKANKREVSISTFLLTDLRYYTLFDQENNIQSGFNFSTYYQHHNSEEAMIRSVISLDGSIMQQIRRDCLEDSEFALQIASAHQWLIEQLLGKLRLKIQIKVESWVYWLSWVVSLLIVVMTVVLNLKHFMSMHPSLMIIAPLLMCWLLQEGIKRLFRLVFPSLRLWLFRELLFGRFSRRQKMQKMALGVLGRIGL